MNNKICLVTGATAGIGRATAQGLAQAGATVIIVGRNPDKSAAAAAHIGQASGNPAVHALTADLSVQADVRRLAQTVGDRYPRLDVLVNNAGGAFWRRRLSADGIELTWALDYLNVYLLTRLLLPSLQASPAGRVVTVSSGGHHAATLDFDDLQFRRSYFIFRAYARAKYAEIMFTYELARRLAGTRVTANVLHPGVVATNIWGLSPVLMRLFRPLIYRFALTPEGGAQTSLYLATSPEVEGITGQYFSDQRPARSAPGTYDEAAARRLWDLSAQLTGL